jgi:hypothetical protein
MHMLMRHAGVRRLMGRGVGMRMIVRGFAMLMLMGMDDNLAAAAAADAVLSADLADSPTFRTFLHILHKILPGCSLTPPSQFLGILYL